MAEKTNKKRRPEGKDKAAVTLPGKVQKIIPPVVPTDPEKAQIEVHDAEHLYRELRVANALEKPSGEKVALKEGAEVDVTIEADAGQSDTKPADDA